MSLAKKKKEVELMKVKTARMDLELRVEEMHEEIKRLQSHIEIQINKEKELETELSK